MLAFFGTICYYTLALREQMYAAVAQLDRVTDYESVGRGFESLSPYQKTGYPFWDSPFFGMEKRTQMGVFACGRGVFNSGRIPEGCGWNRNGLAKQNFFAKCFFEF